MNPCPCQSGRPYTECCERFISGLCLPDTAEELMRSRYSAYVLREIDYIVDTTHPGSREHLDRESIQAWSCRAEWQGLELIETVAGRNDDRTGQVEFIARYSEKGEQKTHHERAFFEQEDGRWFFKDGEPVKPKQYVRPSPKIGRNSPCPCGSGKKHKKCCGATVPDLQSG